MTLFALIVVAIVMVLCVLIVSANLASRRETRRIADDFDRMSREAETPSPQRMGDA